MESKLGPDHPDTLASRNNLATAYRAAGRTAEAIALHEATLKLSEAKLGPRPPRHAHQPQPTSPQAYRDAGRLVRGDRAAEGGDAEDAGQARPRSPQCPQSQPAPPYSPPPPPPDPAPLPLTLRLPPPRPAPRRLSAGGPRRSSSSAITWPAPQAFGPTAPLRPRPSSRSARTGSCSRGGPRPSRSSARARPSARKPSPTTGPPSPPASLLGGSLLGQGPCAEAEPLVVPGYEGMKAREPGPPGP